MKSKMVIFFLAVFLSIGSIFGEEIIRQADNTKSLELIPPFLTMENEPEIGGEAILKLTIGDLRDKRKVKAACHIPKALEFINDQNYKIRDSKFYGSKRIEVVFWEGYMEPGEIKEFIFKVRVLDGKRYEIYSTDGKGGDFFELDLGQPELPEWNIHNDQYRWLTMPGEEPKRVGTNVYELTSNPHERKEIIVEGEQYPPILSELRARSKHIPFIGWVYYSEEVPFRYFIYTDMDTKQVDITVVFPSKDLELIEGDYEVRKEEGRMSIRLYRGSMQAGERKAFFFKVRSINPKKHYMTRVAGTIKVLTIDGRELITEDSVACDFDIIE